MITERIIMMENEDEGFNVSDVEYDPTCKTPTVEEDANMGFLRCLNYIVRNTTTTTNNNNNDDDTDNDVANHVQTHVKFN